VKGHTVCLGFLEFAKIGKRGWSWKLADFVSSGEHFLLFGAGCSVFLFCFVLDVGV
jgi:hypothetical protein